MASTPVRSRASQEWRAHWGIVVAGMLGTGFVAIPAFSLGLFMQPLQHAFGWSRSDVSWGMTVYALVSTPLAPFAGVLADRFGSRRVLVPGLVINALALAAFGLFTGALWQFTLIWACYGLSQLFVRTLFWNRAASAAFGASRGLALAVLMGGIPIAQTIVPLLAQWLIRDYGWRAAYGLIALGWGGLAWVATLLLFHEAGSRSRAGDRAGPPVMALSGQPFGAAMRDPRVIRIAAAILIHSTMSSALGIHLFPLLTGDGVSPATAARVLALLGVAAVLGQITTGWLADRVRHTWLPVSCFALPAVAYLLLLGGAGNIALLAPAVLVAGYSGTAGITITTYLTSRYGGVRHFGKIYGIMSSCMGLGAGIGPLLAGHIFDATGSYAALLIAAAASAVVAGMLVWRLGPYPSFDAEPPAGERASG